MKQNQMRYGALLGLLMVGLFSLSSRAQTTAQWLPVAEVQSLWSGRLQVSASDPFASFMEIQTEGPGKPSFLVWEMPQGVDLSKAHLFTYLRISSVMDWKGIEFRASATKDFGNYVALTLPKYTDPDFNWIQANRWQKISLSLGDAQIQGQVDLKALRYFAVYIESHGLENFQLGLSDLMIRPHRGKALVSVTFDDGHKEHLQAAKIMQKFGLRGTAYVMPREIDSKPEFMTKADLKSLWRDFGWGVSSHHAQPYTLFSISGLDREIQFTLDFLREIGAGAAAEHVAFPLGKTNESMVMPLARASFKTARIAGGGAETLPPADWHRLRVINMVPGFSAKALEARIQKAQLHGEWLILMFHHLVEGTPRNDLDYNLTEFKKAMELVSKSGVEVLPVHEAWEKYSR